MSLSEIVPGNRQSVTPGRVKAVLWFCGALIGGILLLFIVLERLGLPVSIGRLWFVGLLGLALVGCCWLGRTLTSPDYFFAGRRLGVGVLGLGGLADWIGGAFLAILISIPPDQFETLGNPFLLVPALMLGMVLCSTLFVPGFRRVGVSTLSGLMAWRHQNQGVGVVFALLTALILLILFFAEMRIATYLASSFANIDIETARWIMLLLVVLPTVFGGWLSLAVVNAVFSLWVLISMLAPAILVSIFRPVLGTSTVLDNAESQLSTIRYADLAGDFPLAEMGTNPGYSIIAIAVFACGFAALPHAIARLSLSKNNIAALEGTAWTALCAFLAFSAFPLSVALLALAELPPGTELLESQPVLTILPHFAIWLAAINGASVTLFAFSSTLARTFRRSRKLDPGERSMSLTRGLGVLTALAYAFVPASLMLTASTYLLLSLGLSAASLFFPLLFCFWFERVQAGTVILSSLAGSATVVILARPYEIVPTLLPTITEVSITIAAGLGMMASLTVLCAGTLLRALRPAGKPDKRLAQLRNPT
ncbi:MAG: hypothetical protein AAGF28_06005 [Pseudomonadota bacterium]